MKKLLLLLLFPVLSYGQLAKPPSASTSTDAVARDSITAHRVNLDTLFSGRVSGTGTATRVPLWYGTTSLTSAPLEYSTGKLYFVPPGATSRFYIVNTNTNDTGYIGIDGSGNMTFDDEINTETTLSALLAGGGGGDTTFQWSIYGSGTFVTDTLYIRGTSPITATRVGNILTIAADTTTAGTGLATKYQIATREPLITAAAGSDYYWNGSKVFTPFTAGVRGSISGTAGQITYNSTTGIISLVAIDTVGTITSGVWQGTLIDTLRGGTGSTTKAGTLTWLLPSQASASGKFLRSSGSAGSETWETVAGSGTVTGVGLTVPSILSSDISFLSTIDTFNITLATQTANTIFSGPASGAAATPTFRALVSADIPQVMFDSLAGLYLDPTGISSGDLIIHDGTDWAMRALTFSDMTRAWWDSVAHYLVDTTGLGAGDALIFDGTEWNAAASVAVNVSANDFAQMNATGDTLVSANVREDSATTDQIYYAKNDTVAGGLTVGAGLQISAGSLIATSGDSSWRKITVTDTIVVGLVDADSIVADHYDFGDVAELDTASSLTKYTEKAYYNQTSGNLELTEDAGAYIEPSWTLDSTALATYGTNFNKTWFQTGPDSLAVDSLVAVSYDRASGDTVSIRVLWGVDRTSATDSLSDLKCYHSAGGVAAASTKVIPPHRKVWVKVTEEDGAAKEIQFAIKGRRKW